MRGRLALDQRPLTFCFAASLHAPENCGDDHVSDRRDPCDIRAGELCFHLDFRPLQSHVCSSGLR